MYSSGVFCCRSAFCAVRVCCESLLFLLFGIDFGVVVGIVVTGVFRRRSVPSLLGLSQFFLFLFPFRICFLLPLIWLKWSKHRNLGKLYFVILNTRRRFRMSKSVCVCVVDRSTVPCSYLRQQTTTWQTTTNPHEIKGAKLSEVKLKSDAGKNSQNKRNKHSFHFSTQASGMSNWVYVYLYCCCCRRGVTIASLFLV